MRDESSPSVMTEDAMFHGRVFLCQHRDGYRFSVDAVLLSHFAARFRPTETLDVGAGCGVIPLLLADLWQRRDGQTPRIVGLERQPSLAALARKNVAQNQRDEQVEIVEAECRAWAREVNQRFRLVTMNPPFFALGSGEPPAQRERAEARHELHGSLEQLLQAVASLLHPRGSLALVYPCAGFSRMLRALSQAQLHLTRLQWVHPHRDATGSLMLLAASKRQRPLSVEPPIFSYQSPEQKQYSDAMCSMLKGNVLSPWEP